MARPPRSACRRATAMLRSTASMAVTRAPSRVIGSASRPPPQPMSSSFRSAKGRGASGSRPWRAATRSRMKAMRVGLNLCSGRNLPWGSHQASAMAANFAVSAGSMLALRGAAGSVSLGAESLMPCVPLPANFRCSLASVRPNEYGYAPLARQPPNGRNQPPTKDPMAPQPKKPRIVMKFGGTSVGDVERIRAVAQRVKREVDAGTEVAVVVSAMAGSTNQLVDWVRDISRFHDAREYDAVVASGEQVTSGLVALALQEAGVSARSWQGWQIPIVTDDAHGKARIARIDTDEMEKRFQQGMVAVVAGFQGVGPDNRLTTLGRGGSDTTAVALAAALKADRCDIFTDVDGVYTTDPRIVAKARKLDKITYEEMLEMASLGAKVLQIRSVEMAMKHGVRLQVLSSFEVNEDEIMEQELVSGIAYSRDEAKITLVRVPDRPGVAASIFGPLSDANINVDMIVQNVSEDGKNTDMTFTVSKGDFERAKQVLTGKQNSLNFHSLISDSNVVKVSVIGVGMRSHAGIAQRMFKALAEKGINIQVISTSEIKISVLVAEEYTELAVRALHTAYGLDAE